MGAQERCWGSGQCCFLTLAGYRLLGSAPAPHSLEKSQEHAYDIVHTVRVAGTQHKEQDDRDTQTRERCLGEEGQCGGWKRSWVWGGHQKSGQPGGGRRTSLSLFIYDLKEPHMTRSHVFPSGFLNWDGALKGLSHPLGMHPPSAGPLAACHRSSGCWATKPKARPLSSRGFGGGQVHTSTPTRSDLEKEGLQGQFLPLGLPQKWEAGGEGHACNWNSLGQAIPTEAAPPMVRGCEHEGSQNTNKGGWLIGLFAAYTENQKKGKSQV